MTDELIPYVTNSDQLYIIRDGVLYHYVEGSGQSHMSQGRRQWVWREFPTPYGWACQWFSSTANGNLYGLFERHLFRYERDPSVQYGRDLNHWVELPLPGDEAAAEPEKPKPELVHSAVGLPGSSAPFELSEGTFVLQPNSNVATIVLERSVGAGGYRPMPLIDDRRFSLPARSWLRIYCPNADGVDVFKLPT